MSLFDFFKRHQKEDASIEKTEEDKTSEGAGDTVEEDGDADLTASKEVLYAKVIDRICGINTKTSNAYKTVKTVKEFVIVFEDSEGKFRRLLVGENMYDAFEEGQVGTLTLIDGQLDSFVLDEE